MREYIDRKALKEHLVSYAGMFTDELGFAVGLEAVLRGIDFQPAVDAVEVVRCRDCKSYVAAHSSLLGEVFVCTGQGAMNIAKKPEDFCSEGERKEDA